MDKTTDDKKPMAPEEYANQPESNTGATVDRDVDAPRPKVQDETEEEAQRREDGEMLVSDQIAEKQRTDHPNDVPSENAIEDEREGKGEVPEDALQKAADGDKDAQYAVAEEVSKKELDKLDTKTKPGVDDK